MRAIPAVVQHLLRSRADRYPPKIHRGYGHPHRAGAPNKGTADVDGTGAGYELRLSCSVGACCTRMTPAYSNDRRRGSLR